MLSWNGKPNGHFDRNQKPSCYQVKQIFSTWVTPKQYFLGNILAMEGISPIFSLSKTSNSISSLTARPSIDSNLSRAVFTYWVFSTAQWEQTRKESDALHFTHFQWFFYISYTTKGGLTTRFDPPPNGLRELKLHRLSTNVCTKTKMFLKIFFDIRFRSEGA